MKKAAYLFGLAALLVNLPRLLIAYLAADWLLLTPEIEGVLLGITAVGTSLTVTAGGLFIIHTLAKGRHAGAVRVLLVVMWLGLLGALGVLLTPALIANMRKVPLPEALASMGLQGLWSGVAIVAPEILAAGVMVAAVLTEKPAETGARDRPSRWAKLSDALVDAAVDRVAPTPATVTAKPNGAAVNGHTTGIDPSADAAERARAARDLSMKERRRRVASIIEEDPDTPRGELADQFDVSLSTIQRDLRAISDRPNGRAGHAT